MIDGIDGFCAVCEAQVRAGSTATVGRSDQAIVRFLARRLVRQATMVEPVARLVGTVTQDEAAAMDEDAAWQRVRHMRWPDRDGEPRCPKCGSERCSTIGTRRKFRCKDCRYQFSAVSGTAFASFKGGYSMLLKRMAYEGPIEGADVMQPKTACDMSRRKLANSERSH